MTHADQARFDRATPAPMPADPRLARLLAEMLELSAILPPAPTPADDAAIVALSGARAV